MHLQVIMAFALLLWWPEPRPTAPLLTSTLAVPLFVWGRVLLLTAGGWLVTRAALSRLTCPGGVPQAALTFFHRATLVLRSAALAGVAADLFLTAWPEQLSALPFLRFPPGLDRLALLVPYLLSLLAIWWTSYPVERAVREVLGTGKRWSLRQYLVFNFRHQVLIAALPLTAILLTYSATRAHFRWFATRFGTPWAGDAVVGLVTVGVFAFAPVLLRYVWTTTPLPDGPLRRKLQALCGRIDLRVREILVWHSDGVMVNAAVVGVFARLRYILLSDALLESMSDEEIEAVFGHEAGHVRHHHLPFFLLFALASMLVASAAVELLIHLARHGPAWARMSGGTIQSLGLLVVVPLWGIFFGWISRRFERQADVFGARCASPSARHPGCSRACALHDGEGRDPAAAVCARGAETFVAALRKVAWLNGIPLAERSWRHSSIAARIRFLTSLSGDPIMCRRFTRLVRRIKLGLVVFCAGGCLLSVLYVWNEPGYRAEVQRSLIEPIRRLWP